MTPRSIALDELDAHVDALLARLVDSRRFVLGIAGPPGAGKSTVAARIVQRASASVPAVVAPMDGFHRSNEDLESASLLPLKGVPASFDAATFADRVCSLADTSAPLTWPTYDRQKQAVVPDGATVEPQHRLVVVEGNYLLLDTPPWHRIRPSLDEAWYLDVPIETLTPRLLVRHRRNRSAAAAAEKVASTDLPNAELIAGTRHRADLIVTV